MKAKIIFIISAACFILFCGFLVNESGLFDCNGSCPTKAIVRLASDTGEIETPAEPAVEPVFAAIENSLPMLTAVNGGNQPRVLGSTYPDSGFKFELELTSKGAAISRAMLTEYDDRDKENPQPLVLLSPVEIPGRQNIYSLASGQLAIPGQNRGFPLDRLNWQAGDVRSNDGAESITFEAILGEQVITVDGEKTLTGQTVKITKTYTVMPGSYDVLCDITVENLSDTSFVANMKLQGPVGIDREGTRQDSRNIIAAFYSAQGKVESIKLDSNKLRKARKKGISENMKLTRDEAGDNFIWAANTNKYFSAILRPVPEGDADFIKGLPISSANYYDPDDMRVAQKKANGDESIGFLLRSPSFELSGTGSANSSVTSSYQMYLGPKDKSIFSDNEIYKKLGYIHTIKFLSCCLPTAIINPLSFGVMAIMKTMYNMMDKFGIGNYGVVIIIFVALVRLLMHPVTKKSQVSMMKMQKLGPRMEELKKKYAGNRQELQKKTMELYKQSGVSPVSSMLPMMLQMPIWIALYSAIYANVALRGAAFLPVWITDLSAPDALISFNTITVPFLEWQISSFNLLPVGLAVAMFLQQKLMSQKSTASTSPQMAQQQKMMLIMMPFMMLIFLYKAPSALNLYIMTSTFAGVTEQIIIRKHLREKEALEAVGKVPVTSKTGGKVKKKKPKPFYKT